MLLFLLLHNFCFRLRGVEVGTGFEFGIGWVGWGLAERRCSRYSLLPHFLCLFYWAEGLAKALRSSGRGSQKSVAQSTTSGALSWGYIFLNGDREGSFGSAGILLRVGSALTFD